jgi:hypothetical protein
MTFQDNNPYKPPAAQEAQPGLFQSFMTWTAELLRVPRQCQTAYPSAEEQATRLREFTEAHPALLEAMIWRARQKQASPQDPRSVRLGSYIPLERSVAEVINAGRIEQAELNITCMTELRGSLPVAPFFILSEEGVATYRHSLRHDRTRFGVFENRDILCVVCSRQELNQLREKDMLNRNTNELASKVMAVDRFASIVLAAMGKCE